MKNVFTVPTFIYNFTFRAAIAKDNSPPRVAIHFPSRPMAASLGRRGGPAALSAWAWLGWGARQRGILAPAGESISISRAAAAAAVHTRADASRRTSSSSSAASSPSFSASSSSPSSFAAAAVAEVADFWQPVTPPVPGWRSSAPPTALRWLRKYLRTDRATGGRGGLVGPAITARLFLDRRVRMAQRAVDPAAAGEGSPGTLGTQGTGDAAAAAASHWAPGEVKLRRVPRHYLLPTGAWLCIPKTLQLRGDTRLGPDAGHTPVFKRDDENDDDDAAAEANQHPRNGGGGSSDGTARERDGESRGGRFTPPPTPEERRAARALVLYRDEDVLVINKPAGLATMPGPGRFGNRSVESLRASLTFGAHEPPRLVHRLDRDTSGCLILARNASAAFALASYFRKKADEAAAAALAEAAASARGEADDTEGSDGSKGNLRVGAGVEAGDRGGACGGSVERVYWALVSAMPAHGVGGLRMTV